jgi:lauroyl/myristoyl acyltransferase
MVFLLWEVQMVTFFSHNIKFIIFCSRTTQEIVNLKQCTGRVKYMFASFWNRNHTMKTIQRYKQKYHEMIEAEKKVGTMISL